MATRDVFESFLSLKICLIFNDFKTYSGGGLTNPYFVWDR